MTAISMVTMLEATRLTRAGRLMEATALLRPVAPTAMPAVPQPRRARGSEAPLQVRSFRGPAGGRDYKLFVPAADHQRPRGLIVMLHGCTQTPDDFARGTGMNILAEANDLLVVYPAQSTAANAQKCWNWFKAEDQARDGGEPAIIAGIVRQIAQDFAVDPRRIYVAGLSAGGAAAAVMGEVYPDLFAAVGVHSGLACGAASDMMSAFAAMRGGSPGRSAQGAAPGSRFIPTIVFHGDGDTTVNAVNGEQVVDRGRAGRSDLSSTTRSGKTAGGLRFSVTVESDRDGRPVLEHWAVHGAGHAWSGGSPTGSFTEPRGPDASREMVRFFLANPKPGG